MPNKEEQDYIQEKLFAEIEFGIVKSETRERLVSIYNRIVDDAVVEGLILGCTELPLILKPENINGEYLDTTALHIDKIVKFCKSE